MSNTFLSYLDSAFARFLFRVAPLDSNGLTVPLHGIEVAGNPGFMVGPENLFPVALGAALPAGSAVIGGVLIGSASTAGDSTITTDGAAQALFGGTVPANGWKVANPHPTEDLWVADNGITAAPNVGYRVFANGGQYATEPGEKPIGPLSIYGATSGHSFTARCW
jgi:hypothetical protein